MKSLSSILFLLFSTTILFANSTDSTIKTVNFSGFADIQFAYANTDDTVQLFKNGLAGYEPYGFSIPALGLILSGNIGDKTQWEAETGIDSTSLFIRDLFVNYAINKSFQFKAGRFAVPGAFEMWADSSYFGDGNNWFFDRSHAVQRWTIASYNPDGRSMGAQMHGRLFKNKLYYAVMLCNPDGIASFIPKQNTTSYQHFNNSLTGWGRIELEPLKGLKLGTFIGDGKGRRLSDSILVKLIAYGGNICYTNKSIFSCYEFTRAKASQKHYPTYTHGHVFMLTYKWKFIQPVFRYSLHIPNAEKPDELGITHYTNFTQGINFHINPSLFLRVQYVKRHEQTESSDDFITNDLFSISVSAHL